MMASAAFALDGQNEFTGIQRSHASLATRAQNAGTMGGAAAIYDTTWVGHSASNHFNAANNWWNIYTGTYRPGVAIANNALWDFEDLTNMAAGFADSLQGWWPTGDRQGSVAGFTDDLLYSYLGLDHGNQVNYAMRGYLGRTKGVIGAWHADPGKNAGIGVTWAPMSGSYSAWCGLRETNDNTVIDQVTKNPFNSSTAEFNNLLVGLTAKNYPGYCRSWDQMLYRDLAPTAGQPLTLSFLYRTRMSLGANTSTTGRIGWFHGDPLSTTPGNFISAAASAPTTIVDSFQVFIGVPVNEAAVTLSNGTTAPVYDKQRRWFSEVVQMFNGAPLYEVMSRAGANPATTDTTGFNSFSAVIDAPTVASITGFAGNPTGNVRLVFRVKTNSSFDDQAGTFNSASRGAAQIDDVTIQWGAAAASNIGDFEGLEQSGPNSIDNRFDGTHQVNYAMRGYLGRTKGVIGAWHADPGKNAGIGVTWAPMSGSYSAWCGLRETNDNTVIDQVTKNPFNATTAEFNVQNVGLTAKNFPGYCRQWDQMLYRDLVPTAGQPLTLSFLYRTRMSLGANTSTTGRIGWFHGDPLWTAAGNFISAAAAAPTTIVDSFQVYVGVPVNDAAVTLSNGNVSPVFDPQRRWFSEVLQMFNGAPMVEVMARAGANPATTDTTGFVTFSTTIEAPTVASIATSPLNPTGNVRLVFRVKTNSSFDDQAGNFDSASRGAAQIDDVTIQWGAAAASNIGDFEGLEQSGPNSIDNRFDGTHTAVTNWRSTGRPTPNDWHATPLTGLPWSDICGPIGAATRTCNMIGNVLDAGNADQGEALGDPSTDATIEFRSGAISPTIDLTTTVSPNPMGITSAIVGGSDDYYIRYDVYTGDFDALGNTGVFWWWAAQSYPNVQANGAKTWGDITAGGTILYEPDIRCYGDIEPLKAKSKIQTSNASGLPDSLRIYLGLYALNGFYGDPLGANPAFGCYFDNVSLAIVNKTGGSGNVGTISSDIWQWFNDAFPVANGVALGTGTTVAALDTCVAHIDGALNNAQGTATAGLGGLRLSVLADSIVVIAGDRAALGVGDTNSTKVRVDLVFRILPGVGNYQNLVNSPARVYPPNASMVLLQRADNQNLVVNTADVNDHSFWAEYMRAPGQFSSGTHHSGAWWDPLTWNSARCDTVETNFFPSAPAAQVSATFPTRPGFFQSTYHEEDPKFSLLGISHGRCFVIDTTINLANSTNVVCGSAPAWVTTVPQSRTGWDGTVTTKEGTKILPDGLLTPGAHVQYFFRKSQIFQFNGYALDPDTEQIIYQATEDNYDQHRWQEIGVLPDRWKDTQFGGSGMACMLYADYNDRRGDEAVWVSVMDSIGGTASNKWGAHNGWHAAGGVNLNVNSNPSLPAQAYVYGRNAQPGTTWDKYDVRATESGSSVGTRIGGRVIIQGADLLLGHDANVAPTPAMLRQYYRFISLLTGDLNSGDLGPRLDLEQPEDDIAILTDFLSTNAGLTAKPRGLFVAGHGFAESEAADPAHATWMASWLGTNLVNASYRALSGNTTAGCSDLYSATVITPAADIYGVQLSCRFTNDVLAANPSLPLTAPVSWYEGPTHTTYAASVYHPANGSDNWISLVDGFDLYNMWGRYCTTSYGRLAYTYKVMTNVFGSLCNNWGPPSSTLDVPSNGRGGQLVNFMKVGNSVMRSGNATIRFGVEATGRARLRLYDVTGRLVRTLADKTYQGGQEYSVLWDGRDDGGNQVARGVYFARIDYADGKAVNGRVVVLQ